MVNALVDAASNNEDADAKSLLQCTATWLNHAYNMFNGDYSLYATGDNPYDIGKDPAGTFVDTGTFTWSSGTATITLPSDLNLFTGEVLSISAGAYSGLHTITRTGPTTATF